MNICEEDGCENEIEGDTVFGICDECGSDSSEELSSEHLLTMVENASE